MIILSDPVWVPQQLLDVQQEQELWLQQHAEEKRAQEMGTKGSQGAEAMWHGTEVTGGNVGGGDLASL